METTVSGISFNVTIIFLMYNNYLDDSISSDINKSANAMRISDLLRSVSNATLQTSRDEIN